MAEDAPGSGGSVIKEFGKKGPGGVPVWGYGVGLAAVFILFMYIRGRNKAPSVTTGSVTPDATATTDTSSGSGFPYQPIQDWLTQNPGSAAYPVGVGNSGLPSPISNAQWARQAADELNALGNDPSLVANALSKYLNGQALSAAEQSVVNLALQKVGSPPEGVMPVVTTPPPANDQNPPPTNNPPPSDPNAAPPGVQISGPTNEVRGDGTKGKKFSWQAVDRANSYNGTFNGWPFNVQAPLTEAHWWNAPAHGVVTITPMNGYVAGPTATLTF